MTCPWNRACPVLSNRPGRRPETFSPPSVPERIPAPYRGRIEQVAEFFKRVLKHWQEVKLLWAPPVETDRQMTASAWEALRETLYQVEKTEETCARLLGSVAHELFEQS